MLGSQIPPPHPLWTEGMTHACENITFPQLLLRAVKIGPRGRARPYRLLGSVNGISDFFSISCIILKFTCICLHVAIFFLLEGLFCQFPKPAFQTPWLLWQL